MKLKLMTILTLVVISVTCITELSAADNSGTYAIQSLSVSRASGRMYIGVGESITGDVCGGTEAKSFALDLDSPYYQHFKDILVAAHLSGRTVAFSWNNTDCISSYPYPTYIRMN